MTIFEPGDRVIVTSPHVRYDRQVGTFVGPSPNARFGKVVMDNPDLHDFPRGMGATPTWCQFDYAYLEPERYIITELEMPA